MSGATPESRAVVGGELVATELPAEGGRRARSLVLAEFFRYTLVGGLAYVVDFAVLAGLTEIAGIHYLGSAAVAFLTGLVLNYVLSVRWVFARRNVSDRRAEFFVFAAVGLVGLLLNEVLLWAFTDVVGFHYFGSKVLTAGFLYLWNFSLRKLLLFR